MKQCELCGNRIKARTPSEVKLRRFCSIKCSNNSPTTKKKISDSLTGIKRSEKTRKKTSVARTGKGNGQWKGGKWENQHGYVFVKSHNHPNRNANNYVTEHRLVVEKHIGRYLDCNEVVHHINGIRNDNNIDNLIIMTQGDHTRHHWKGQKRDGKCGKMIREADRCR